MNWLDLVITVTWISGLFLGWKMGLFGAVFAAGGAVVGVFLAARFSDNVADLLTDSVTSDTLATVIAYVAILALVFTAAQVLRTVLIEGLKRVAMGWLDPVGGMLLGLVAGLAPSRRTRHRHGQILVRPPGGLDRPGIVLREPGQIGPAAERARSARGIQSRPALPGLCGLNSGQRYPEPCPRGLLGGAPHPGNGD